MGCSRNSFFFSLVVLIVSLVHGSRNLSSFLDSQTEALLSLKAELDNSEDVLKDWFVPSRDVSAVNNQICACTWSGVFCNENSTMVTGLNLSNKNLSGSLSGKQFGTFTELVDLNLSHNSFSGNLPVELFNLSSLTILDISRNNFSGHFPGGVSGLKNLVVLDAFSNSFSGPLPVEVSQLESLQILNLAGSYFSGPIPGEYGSFRKLEFMHLAGNFLTGNIPETLGMLSTLTHMEIGYNFYQGGIPLQMGNMSELQYLDIAGSNLSGLIPKTLSNLTNLQSLFLFRNQLTGPLPWEFSQISSLTDLDLSDNLIYGPIPQSFVELKNLKLLSLMYNDMIGDVPHGIAELPMLDTLFLWNNYFTGSLPPSLGRNSKLKWLDVSTNYFNGSIPPGICSGGVLSKLILFSNNFTGSLFPLANCSSLVRLRIEDNSFSGEIPLKFSLFKDISYVDLSGNKFVGGIPTDLFEAHKLEIFSVSNNPDLGGTISPQTWSLPLLQNFSASFCNISGNLPPFSLCKSIVVIDLKMNNIKGNIPKSVANCLDIERLDLSHNSLGGAIPEELATLRDLSVLDLSHNNITGHIPSKFGSSSNLVSLNVSFNDISGSIPFGKDFWFMGRNAFEGNPKLCGAPLQPCKSGQRENSWKLALVLVVCAGVILLLTSFMAAFYHHRKGFKGQWTMVSFSGLPQFTANDVLKSFITADLRPPSQPVTKAVLPTGLIVSVKKIHLDAKGMKVTSELITRMGNARHKNLIRLLGFCYNNEVAYLLYDCSPHGSLAEKIGVARDWGIKFKILMAIARGLGYLHSDCFPAIPHGDLKSYNIALDDDMEAHLAEFGFGFLMRMTKEGSFPDIGELKAVIKEELFMDIYDFGELIMEVLTNGGMVNAGVIIQSKPRSVLLRDLCTDDAMLSNTSLQDEIKMFLDVALLCTRSRPSDRPSMEVVLKLLSRARMQRK